jgi:aminoglycoside phosphotransferase (APT) family kinase protein
VSGTPRSPRWDVPLKPRRADPEWTRERLRRWLGQRWPQRSGLRLSPLQWHEGSGASNETILFESTWDTGAQRLVARLQTDDPLYLDASIERQCRMYEALSGVTGVAVPAIVGYEPEPEFLGTPFFVMERIDGLVPSGNPHFTKGGWVVDAGVAERERLWRSAVESLVALHRVEVARVSFLQQPERGDDGLEQDLSYWQDSYRWAACGEVHPVMEAGGAWLADHRPEAGVTALSWGDARLENMVFRDFRCVATLDFESASLAGPTADLAWWALMDKASSELAGLGSPRETIQLYQELGGAAPSDLRYFLVLGAYRLAAIYLRLAEQLAARGALTDATRDLGRNSEKMQQLALLLEAPPPGPVTATLPDLDL